MKSTLARGVLTGLWTYFSMSLRGKVENRLYFFFSFYGVVGVGAALGVSDDRRVLQGWLGAKQVLWFAFGQQER